MTPAADDAGRIPADALIAALQREVAACLAAAVPPGPVALVDFPDHSNVGDSAIWLGEMAWLDDAGRTPVYSASLADFSAKELQAAAPEGPILIHGGGNFGTIWRSHEELRLHLLRRFRGRPIVQLPQSIHYEDAAAVREMAEAIAAHGAFTLLVRDAASLDFAARHFDCEVRLCPDSALYLGRFARRPASVDVLALLRTDRESVGDDLPAAGVDWLAEDPSEWKRLSMRLKAESLLALTAQGRRLRRYRRLAGWRLMRGLELLSRGKIVVTDRLHAHILALLLDIPHVALDTRHGKLRAFAAQWTARYRGFHAAASPAVAFEHARALAAEI